MEKEIINKLIQESEKAAKSNNVPIACIITLNNKIIAKSHNKKETSKVATDHAEIIAIKKANKKLKTWYLNDCILYVTLKPCEMCLGAIKEARIKKVIYLNETNYHKNKDNTSVNLIKSNYLNEEYNEILKTFFKKLRIKK